METYRQAMDDDRQGLELEAAIAEVMAADFTIAGDQFRRIPQSFDTVYPHTELLKYRRLHTY